MKGEKGSFVGDVEIIRYITEQKGEGSGKKARAKV